jgi:hypothetical protein
MDTGDSQPSREQAPDISDEDEDELIIYCTFSDPVSESDEPRPKFDFTKPVVFVDPVRRSGLPEYEELEAEREKERERAERRLERQAAQGHPAPHQRRGSASQGRPAAQALLFSVDCQYRMASALPLPRKLNDIRFLICLHHMAFAAGVPLKLASIICESTFCCRSAIEMDKAGAFIQLGNGQRTKFWTDNWLPGGRSVQDIVPVLFSFVRDSGISVAAALDHRR